MDHGESYLTMYSCELSLSRLHTPHDINKDIIAYELNTVNGSSLRSTITNIISVIVAINPASHSCFIKDQNFVIFHTRVSALLFQDEVSLASAFHSINHFSAFHLQYA